jgi:hypothetical protein
MKQSGEEDLRARFAELRDGDRAHAPEFGALLRRADLRARTTARSRTMRAAWIVAAAGIVLTAGILFRGSRGVPTHDSISGTTISNWRSPTSGLLRTPGIELLAPPAIFSSILDGATGVTGATVQPQGD